MLATGSTGRNAGGVRHQFSNDANISLSIESIGLLERFADEVGQPIDFHQDGYLFLLSSPASVETFRRNVALQRTLGVDVQWLDAGEAAALAPGLDTDGVLAATFCQRDGIADPNGVTMGFAKAAQAAGVPSSATPKSRASASTRGRVDGGGHHARHDRDAHRRQRGGSARARDRAHGRRGRAGGSVSAAISSSPPARTARRWRACPRRASWSSTSRRRSISTARARACSSAWAIRDEQPTFDTTVQWDFLPQVIDVAVRRLPALADASISHAWAGLYEMSPDGTRSSAPRTASDGLFLINGFSGHGFQHSPAAGRILADVIAGPRSAVRSLAVRADRLRPAPSPASAMSCDGEVDAIRDPLALKAQGIHARGGRDRRDRHRREHRGLQHRRRRTAAAAAVQGPVAPVHAVRPNPKRGDRGRSLFVSAPSSSSPRATGC